MRKILTVAIVFALMGSDALHAAPNSHLISNGSVGLIDSFGAEAVNGPKSQPQIKTIRLNAAPKIAQPTDNSAKTNNSKTDGLKKVPEAGSNPDAQNNNTANVPPSEKNNLSPVKVVIEVPDHDDDVDKPVKAAARPDLPETSPPEPTANLPRRHVGANEEKPAGKDGDRRYYTRRGFSTAIGGGTNKSSLINGCPETFSQRPETCQIENNQAPAPYRFLSPQPKWWGLKTSDSGRFFYQSGYLVRASSNNRINGYFPLPGGALSPGNIWPKQLKSNDLPEYYRAYFNLGRDGGYHFIDHIIYRVDPENQFITSIAALITGSAFTIGKPLPSGYDIYNVPHAYREMYPDSDIAHYRYSDGYIYKVDTRTRIVTSAIELIPS